MASNMRVINGYVSAIEGATSLTRSKARALRPHMANWLTMHAHIVAVEEKYGDTPMIVIDEVKHMIFMELTEGSAHNPRWSAIDRLHSRLTRWRKKVEEEEMRAWLSARRKILSKPI